MAEEAKSSSRLRVQMVTGKTAKGRDSHKSTSVYNVNPDAPQEELDKLIEALRNTLLYPISKVEMVSQTVTPIVLAENREKNTPAKKAEKPRAEAAPTSATVSRKSDETVVEIPLDKTSNTPALPETPEAEHARAELQRLFAETPDGQDVSFPYDQLLAAGLEPDLLEKLGVDADNPLTMYAQPEEKTSPQNKTDDRKKEKDKRKAQAKARKQNRKNKRK